MKTPLFDLHKELGGTMVDFAGFDLPVQYPTGIIAEHTAVRTAVGLFDVSHMGEIKIFGPEAESALNQVLSNDIRGMYDGQVRYSLLPNENGGAVDDILIYKESAESFLLVVNAANTDKDFAHLLNVLPEGDYILQNISSAIGQIAIQGPMSKDVMVKLTDNLPEKYYSFKKDVDIAGVKTIVSRTGYTGEDGYEIYSKAEDTEKIYRLLLESGKEFGITPCGLGARDTLRLEAGMPLYGHELRDDINIKEVGLDFAVKLSKESFVGKDKIESYTPKYFRAGAFVTGGIARKGSEVVNGSGEAVGYVTSGTFSPTLKKAICMLRLKRGLEDGPLYAMVRGRKLELELTPIPFYKRNVR